MHDMHVSIFFCHQKILHKKTKLKNVFFHTGYMKVTLTNITINKLQTLHILNNNNKNSKLDIQTQIDINFCFYSAVACQLRDPLSEPIR